MEKELKAIADAVNKINRPSNSIIKIDLDVSNVINTIATQSRVKIEIIPQNTKSLDLPPFMKKQTPEGGGLW